MGYSMNGVCPDVPVPIPSGMDFYAWWMRFEHTHTAADDVVAQAIVLRAFIDAVVLDCRGSPDCPGGKRKRQPDMRASSMEQALAEFVLCTRAPKRVAQEYLEASSFDLDAAIRRFDSMPPL